jgi:hypothetical protein
MQRPQQWSIFLLAPFFIDKMICKRDCKMDCLASKNARVAGWLLNVFHFFVWIANNRLERLFVICNVTGIFACILWLGIYQWIIYEQESYWYRTHRVYLIMAGFCRIAAATAGARISGTAAASRRWLAACPVDSTREFKKLYTYGPDR